MTEREPYWDSLKFVLIALVILGHVVESDNSRFCITVFNFIYAFHIPLFLFVSGRFSQIKKDKYRIGIYRLIETYVVFQTLIIVKRIIMQGTFHIEDLWIPGFNLWYLMTLVFYRLMILVIPQKKIQHITPVLCISFLISLLGGFFSLSDDLVLSNQRTMLLLPIFMLGYYSNRIDVKKYIKCIPIWTAWAAVVILLFVSWVLASKDINIGFTTCNYAHPCQPSNNLFLNLLTRVLFLCNACIIGICIMRIIPNNHLLSAFGSKTMILYIFHAFILVWVIRPAITKGLIPCNNVWLIIYTILIIFVLLLFSKLKVSTFLLNPVSNSFKWIKKYIR